MAGGTRPALEGRERLVAPKAEGLSPRAIAHQLGRAASTTSRELRRDALPRGGHPPVPAEGCHRERRQWPALLELGRFVRERIPQGWTPERTAGWPWRGEERGLGRVSAEPIDALVHRLRQKGEKLRTLLPRGRAGRSRRRTRQPRSTAGP